VFFSTFVFTDFRLSWWVIVDVDSAHGSLHCVDVSSAANIPEVHAASSFRIEASRVSECHYCPVVNQNMEAAYMYEGNSKSKVSYV
jgi:hypothetical protein